MIDRRCVIILEIHAVRQTFGHCGQARRQRANAAICPLCRNDSSARRARPAAWHASPSRRAANIKKPGSARKSRAPNGSGGRQCGPPDPSVLRSESGALYEVALLQICLTRCQSYLMAATSSYLMAAMPRLAGTRTHSVVDSADEHLAVTKAAGAQNRCSRVGDDAPRRRPRRPPSHLSCGQKLDLALLWILGRLEAALYPEHPSPRSR